MKYVKIIGNAEARVTVENGSTGDMTLGLAVYRNQAGNASLEIR
jgi:hypothetical protein